MKISKSDYVLGIKCPNAIWFKKFRKDIETQYNQAVFDAGNMVGQLACKRFAGGVQILAKPWDRAAITRTQSAITDSADFIYEATFITPAGEYCAIDILRRNADNTWDIIEVKSNAKPKEYHYIDVSFQKYVCQTAGINIKNCYIMTLNPDYVRHGDLDLEELFTLHDASAFLQSTQTVAFEIKRVRDILETDELAVAISKAKCSKKFYECPYKNHCWANVPEYSVFDVFRGKMADEMYDRYGADLANVPSDEYIKQMHAGDIESFLSHQESINKPALAEFVKTLKYPLFFLDYESINPAVPLFDNSRPYQQICFQFSLHVLRAPGGELEHYEFLHGDQSDPRPDLIRDLIRCCEASGDIIVYNDSFEKSRNREMATDFPEYADALNAINNRVVDLLIPFRTRMLYRPCQQGSASIKKTLPAFVPEMSYAGLEINNGADASQEYLDFLSGKKTTPQIDAMMKNLHKYCEQDTLAMVKLLAVINDI